MRGETILTLDDPIKISENGNFAEVTSLTLRAPGLGKRHVHATMTAFVMEAISSLQSRRSSLEAMAKTQPADVGGSLNVDDEDAPKAAEKDEDPLGVWQMMAMGLGPERFQQFSDYVMKTLTGTPKLATAGDNGSPVTDAVWEALDEVGGMDAVDRVLGTFTGFFLVDRKSKRTSGPATSPSSSSATKAQFPSSTRANSRSRN